MYLWVELQDGCGKSYFRTHGLDLTQVLGLKDVHYKTFVLTMCKSTFGKAHRTSKQTWK
jgi:hypothetical protein